MEVSLQSKFNCFQFRSSPPPRHFCKKEARLWFSSSLIPLNPHGFCIKFPAFKHSFWRNSNIYGFPNTRILGQKRYARAFWHPFHFREKLFRKNFSAGLHNQYISSRYIAVRSEVADTGSAGSVYSLSELQFMSRIRGVFFYAITSIVAIFLFVLMVVAHPFVLLFDRYQRKAHHLIAKTWSILTLSPFFAIEFEGLENLPPPETPAVYVSNHQSFLDIYTLLTLGRSFKFISKTSIFLFPVIGWAMYFLGTIPLKRMDSRSQMDCLKQCMDLVKKGASVFFFPEGTRSKDGKLGAFKVGSMEKNYFSFRHSSHQQVQKKKKQKTDLLRYLSYQLLLLLIFWCSLKIEICCLFIWYLQTRNSNSALGGQCSLSHALLLL